MVNEAGVGNAKLIKPSNLAVFDFAATRDTTVDAVEYDQHVIDAASKFFGVVPAPGRLEALSAAVPRVQ